MDLKKEFDAFIDIQSKNMKDVKENEAEFQKMVNEKNEKIGFDHEAVNIPMQPSEFSKRLIDIQMAREQEVIDLAPKKIFNSNSEFDKDRFNEIFENIHSKKSKQIIPIEQIGTLSDYNVREEISHVPIDQESGLFENGIDTNKFSKFLNDDDIPDISIKPASKNKKSVMDDKPDESEIMKRMSEYRQQTQELLSKPEYKKEIDKGFTNDIISKIIDEQYGNEKDIFCVDTKNSDSSKNSDSIKNMAISGKSDVEIKIDNESEKKIITEKLIKMEIKKKKLLEKLKKIEKSEDMLNNKKNTTTVTAAVKTSSNKSNNKNIDKKKKIKKNKKE
jgi:hypothetical protein